MRIGLIVSIMEGDVKMNRTIKFLLGIFVLTSLSCNALTRSLPVSDPSTSNPESPFVPTIPSNPQANPTSVNQPESQAPSSSDTQCDGDKWTFGPHAVYRYPEGNGFDFTIVDLAIHNGSDKYWANNLIINYSYIYITTEDGYKYLPFNGWYDDVPAVPNSPYSGTRYSQYNMLYIKIPVVPPSFTALGIVGAPMPGEVNRYSFGFEVASGMFEK
jgi:hypothetical protein